jgi:hypothetical protein
MGTTGQGTYGGSQMGNPGMYGTSDDQAVTNPSNPGDE